MADLATRFRARLPAPLRDRFGDDAALAPRLDALVAEGRAAWPAIDADPVGFVEFVAERLPADAEPDDALAALHVADLYLAHACARGDRRGLEAFESHFAQEIARGVETMAGDAVRSDDFKQEIRHKLFLGKPGAGPKIAEYSGRGSLRRWVRITAKRTYIDLMRSRQREQEVLLGDEIVSERAASEDPELAYVKHRYQQEFRTSFQDALGGLTTRQRNILRHHFVHRLRLDEIAGIYRVHRATVARWIAEARAQLLEHTRASLSSRLDVPQGEFDSIMRLLQSDLEVTVSRLLKKPQPG